MPATGAHDAPLMTPPIVMPRGRVGMTIFASSLVSCRLRDGLACMFLK